MPSVHPRNVVQWTAHLLWEQGAASSNLAIPTFTKEEEPMNLPGWVWVIIVIAVLCALGMMNLSISF